MSTAKFFSSPWRTLGFFLLVLITLIWLLPFLTALLTSVRTNDDILTQGFIAIPKEWTLQNFVTAWNRGGLHKYLPNSFIITIPALFATLLLSSLSAYALARFKFPGNRLLASATVDRLRHNAYCLTLDGASYRAPRQGPNRAKNALASTPKNIDS